MKYLTLTLVFLSSIIYAQGTFTWSDTTCYTRDKYGNETVIDCDEVPWVLPQPIFRGNIDSLCWEMEKRFVETLNDWRSKHGLHKLEYDQDMHDMLTLPHNEWQAKMGRISHGVGDNSLRSRSSRVGINGVGECCAYNHRSDVGGVSQFFLQYKNSPPHWDILTDDFYHYIAVSVIYDQETNRYYSAVNVR